MQCTGRVLEERGSIARVLIESTACDHCQACGFAGIRDHKVLEVNAVNRAGAAEGDTVHLEVSGKRVMEASAILFLIPFAGFIVGFLLGYFAIGPLFDAPTPAALVAGLALMAPSYYLVHLLGNRSEFEFVIVELAGEAEPAATGGNAPPR